MGRLLETRLEKIISIRYFVYSESPPQSCLESTKVKAPENKSFPKENCKNNVDSKKQIFKIDHWSANKSIFDWQLIIWNKFVVISELLISIWTILHNRCVNDQNYFWVEIQCEQDRSSWPLLERLREMLMYKRLK